MKRLLFRTFITLAVPGSCFAMNTLTKQHPDVVPGKDKMVADSQGYEYTLFYYYDRVYAHRLVIDTINNTTTIHVFDDLQPYTTLQDSTKSQWTENEFTLLRSIDANLNAIQKTFNVSAANKSIADQWLGANALDKYTNQINEGGQDYDEALRVALVQGKDGLPGLQAYSGKISNVHRQLLHDIHMAKLKFYGPIALGISCVLGGLYAGYRWYVGTCDETEHDQNLAPEDTQAQPVTQD